MQMLNPDRNARHFGVYRDSEALPDAVRGAVVAIGNFDGVHLGHQQLIALAKAKAAARGGPAAVLTFEPHPRAFFAPETLHFRLTSEPVRLKIFERLGLDAVFVRRFDAQLASTTARDFVAHLLGRDLGVSGLVVGGDFHFGRKREGTPALLVELAAQNGLTLALADTVEVAGAAVSSSRIREALTLGDVERANLLLGYSWFVEGEVRHGAKRGRELGYPTANIRLDEGCGLAHGIYAVRVAIGPGEIRGGVASFGRRPTFDNGAPLLECYLFDISADLYGRRIEVEFVGRIRAEERFATADALVEQMRQDVQAARNILGTHSGEVTRSFIG